jgi:signal transduction histidine kinase
MERPHNIDDLAPEIRLYILSLEQKIEDTEQDGIPGLLIVMNRKINQIARSIDEYEFKIESSEDRAYERFWTAMRDVKKISEDLTTLRVNLGLKEEDVKDKRTPMEKFAEKRKEKKNDGSNKTE